MYLILNVSSSLSSLLCPLSTERRPVPWAPPHPPWLHGPDDQRPGGGSAPGSVCPHAHGDPLRPPAARLHHGSAALAYGHPVPRLPPGPAGGQAAVRRPPPHLLASRGPRAQWGRGGWVLVSQTSRSEEAKASGTSHTWDSQTMSVCTGVNRQGPSPRGR